MSAQGVATENVLGTIDTEKLTKVSQLVATAKVPAETTSVTVETTVEEALTARLETTTEIITPAATRPERDTTNPIAPEVQALAETKSNYTTADIAAAQLAAVLATTASTPTTIVTTTRTTQGRQLILLPNHLPRELVPCRLRQPGASCCNPAKTVA